MEYLDSFNDSLKSIDESNYAFYDIKEFSNMFFGSNPFINDSNFSIKEFDCGNRICFSTSSSKVVFKVQLSANKENNLQLCDWNSRGFDVYLIRNDEYVHKTVFAPFGDNNIFADVISNVQNENICIYLPNFFQVEKMMIGVEKNASINELNLYDDEKLLFLGNTITQGASVSRSGNSYPNLVSRKLNRDILNICNISSKDFNENFADKILKSQFKYIIIYFSINDSFNQNLSDISDYFQVLSDGISDKKVIYVVDDLFVGQDSESVYKKFFTNDVHNVILYLSYLFDDDELDYTVYDKYHFSDYAMQIIAQKICEYIK